MMKTGLKLLLLSAVTLVSAQWRNYQDLPDSYKTHIDKALKEANKNFGGSDHVAYENVLSTKFTEKGYYLNVRLMVSTCTKDEKKGYGYREECVTKKSQKPVILCAVCNKHDGGELTECAKLKELKKRREIQNKCSVFYFPGSEHPLFLKTGDNERDFECLGCV